MNENEPTSDCRHIYERASLIRAIEQLGKERDELWKVAMRHLVALKGLADIIVSEDGKIVNHIKARREYDVSTDFTLISRDGRMLGTPEDLADKAYECRKSDWIGFHVEGEDHARHMIDWERREELLEKAHRK